MLMSWRNQAACRGCMPLFFLVEGEDQREKRVREDAAKTICSRCPVKSPCREDALEHGDDFAIRAGMTPQELRILRRRRKETITA